MREALASMDNDFRLRDRAAGSGRAGGLFGALRYLGRRPGRTMALAAFGAVAAAVVANALILQAGRHPAPLFGTAAPKSERVARLDEPARDSPASALKILPPARPVERAAPAPAPAEPPPPAAAPSHPARDAIGDLIRQTGARADPPRLVASAQRALGKLGYGPMKPDGVMGAGTRAAIERFQKAKALPVTGELSPRLAKALASAAGMPVE